MRFLVAKTCQDERTLFKKGEYVYLLSIELFKIIDGTPRSIGIIDNKSLGNLSEEDFAFSCTVKNELTIDDTDGPSVPGYVEFLVTKPGGDIGKINPLYLIVDMTEKKTTGKNKEAPNRFENKIGRCISIW